MELMAVSIILCHYKCTLQGCIEGGEGGNSPPPWAQFHPQDLADSLYCYEIAPPPTFLNCPIRPPDLKSLCSPALCKPFYSVTSH